MADDIVTRLRTVVAVPNGVDIWTTTALDAAAEIERLRAEAYEDEHVRERMSDLLHGVANALHGGSPDGGMHSWHDLPELAERLRAEVARLGSFLHPIGEEARRG